MTLHAGAFQTHAIQFILSYRGAASQTFVFTALHRQNTVFPIPESKGEPPRRLPLHAGAREKSESGESPPARARPGEQTPARRAP